MTSVCVNNDDVESLDFYVFGLGLSDEVKRNLLQTGANYGRKVHVIQIDGFMDNFGDFDTFGWNEVVLSRLLVDSFLPRNVDRVLHLDGDTIVRGSLKQLWETPLRAPELIGAVIEPTVNRHRLVELGLESEPYYNAGVLLINLDEWRMGGIERRLIDYCAKNHKKLFANDQDAINALLKGRIRAVPPTYNYCNSYEFYPYRTLKGLMNGVPYYSEREVFEAIQDPCIVHYLGEERPWREGNAHTYKDDYRHYLEMTPYKGIPEEPGWSHYFRAWQAFNTVTRHIPMVRYRIITALIPRMLSIRKMLRQAS